MAHMGTNTIFHPSYQGPFHGEKGPGKKCSGLVKEYMIYNTWMYMVKYRGG